MKNTIKNNLKIKYMNKIAWSWYFWSHMPGAKIKMKMMRKENFQMGKTYIKFPLYIFRIKIKDKTI